MTIEIVSFPIKNGWIFRGFFVCLPEGTNIQMEIQPIWGDCGNIGMADPLKHSSSRINSNVSPWHDPR